MNDIFYIIDNGLCVIGAISLLLATIIGLKIETSTSDNKKKRRLKSIKYYDFYKITLICSIVAVVSFVLFGISMFIQTCMW